MIKNVAAYSVIVLVLASAPCLADSELMTVAINLPDVVKTEAPIWWRVTLQAHERLTRDNVPLELTFGHPPRLSLRRIDTNERVSPLVRAPQYMTGPVAGSLRSLIQSLYLKDGRPWQGRYLLNERFGRLPVGEYELTVELVLTGPRDLLSRCPGREASELGILSPDTLVNWQLPPAKARFRVMAADRGQNQTTREKVRQLLSMEKAIQIPLDDWVSLLLSNEAESHQLAAENIEQMPYAAVNLYCLLLLNDGSGVNAVQRAAPLLNSDRWHVRRVAFEVLRQRGDRADVRLLEDSLTSANHETRTKALFTIADILKKPISPKIERNGPTEHDFQVARLWLLQLREDPENGQR